MNQGLAPDLDAPVFGDAHGAIAVRGESRDLLNGWWMRCGDVDFPFMGAAVCRWQKGSRRVCSYLRLGEQAYEIAFCRLCDSCSVMCWNGHAWRVWPTNEALNVRGSEKG